MVLGGDSRSKGRGFKSQHCILDGHFYTSICCKNLYCLFEKTENKQKEAGVGPFFKKRKDKLGSFSYHITTTYTLEIFS